MKILRLLFVVLAIFGITYAQIHTDDCGKSSDDFQVSSIDFSPNPPVSGKPLDISVSGNLKKTVTSGQAKLSVDYEGIPIIDGQKFNICKLSKKYPCPLKEGDITLGGTVDIPRYSPSGKYKGKVTAVDQDKQEILCFNFHFKL
eukprot:gb/GECH01007571.1/.p1 GENE.gb/GECH01007571.1/~~gb/GECH01007571.1/.p1  ORF type:complete len:144 (+),score=27.43 gb/GECH01007571.1/:1-432(+)